VADIAATRALLGQLSVHPLGPLRGYDRLLRFGDAWADVDHNGCDTRNDILRRDLQRTRPRASCDVRRGVLLDPYTSQVIRATPATMATIQIDHVVALGLAWRLGAATWGEGERVTFANDPANLLAVDAHSNESKGDGGPDTWLPPVVGYRCTYVARFTRVAWLYHLSITKRIRTAVERQLTSCQAMVGDPATLTALSRSLWASAARYRPTAAQPSTGHQSGVYYANCAAVIAAGKAPLFRGQPGYSMALDRDGDGVACETS
jgi:hypothetical protein